MKYCFRSAASSRAFLLVLLLSAASLAMPGQGHSGPKEVRIGVLAYRGDATARAMWAPTATYLGSAIPGKTFTIVPLGFHEIDPAVGNEEIDFLLANTSIYVEAEALYGVSRIATLKNRDQRGGYTVFGGVVISRADRRDIQGFGDLKGKTFMGVDETSLGGWRVAWRELKDSGIDPYRDFKRLEFGDTHDAVVRAVLDGTVDAGTVRTDTIERMAVEGKIDLKDLNVLNRKSYPGFPFALSSRLYPEWPFARLRHTDDLLAQNVVIALLKMPADSPAAKAAKIMGWTVPLDYEPVHALMRELRLGPYKDYGRVSLAVAVRQYWYWVVVSLLVLLSMAAATVYVTRLNRTLATARRRLEESGEHLAQQVRERTVELRLANEGLSREVEERKQAEERSAGNEEFIRSILNSVDEGFIVVDKEYRVLTVNKAYCAKVGKSWEDVIGRPCYEISHRQPRPCALEGEECAVDAVFATGKPHMVIHRHPLPTGGYSVVENKAFPLKNASGAVVSAIEVITDITDRHQLEEERLKIQKLESIGTLAGGIAHDFNNLLQGILGYLSLAQSPASLPETSRAALDQARKALEQSVKLTNQLLTFAKGGKPVMRALDLRPVIESAAKFALSGSRSEHRLSADEDLWQVEADEGQIGQVFQNIVLNACQAMPTGGSVGITVQNARSADGAPIGQGHDGHWVRITITDTGEGIPQKHLGKIFDPYFSTKAKGSGLGLATAYSIVKNHNGLISVTSEVGKGSTFVVSLPSTGESLRPTVAPPAAVAAAGRSLRVLVMDDDDVVLNVAGELLKLLGHSPEFAVHGSEAIEKYRAAQGNGNRFDVVILDLTIRGGMGGMETIGRLREIDPGVKAVVSSGYSDDTAIANYREQGFLAFLKKPYDVDGLREVLQDIERVRTR